MSRQVSIVLFDDFDQQLASFLRPGGIVVSEREFVHHTEVAGVKCQRFFQDLNQARLTWTS